VESRKGRPYGAACPAAPEGQWHTTFGAAAPCNPEWALDFNYPECRPPVRIAYKLLSDDTEAFDWHLLEVLDAARWPER
jgi:hypothetical protein